MWFWQPNPASAQLLAGGGVVTDSGTVVAAATHFAVEALAESASNAVVSDHVGYDWTPTNVYNTFESGTDETTITTANSGGASGVAFSSVTGSGTHVFDAAFASHGALSARLSATASNYTSYFVWDEVAIGGYPTDHYGRAYLRLGGLPYNNARIVEARYAAGLSAAVVITATGAVAAMGADSTVYATSTTQLSTGQWYRLEWRVRNRLTGSGGGRITIRIYQGDSSTPLEEVDTAAPTHAYTSLARIGIPANAASWGATEFWLDSLVFAATSWPGPAAVSESGVLSSLSQHSANEKLAQTASHISLSVLSGQEQTTGEDVYGSGTLISISVQKSSEVVKESNNVLATVSNQKNEYVSETNTVQTSLVLNKSEFVAETNNLVASVVNFGSGFLFIQESGETTQTILHQSPKESLSERSSVVSSNVHAKQESSKESQILYGIISLSATSYLQISESGISTSVVSHKSQESLREAEKLTSLSSIAKSELLKEASVLTFQATHKSQEFQLDKNSLQTFVALYGQQFLRETKTNGCTVVLNGTENLVVKESGSIISTVSIGGAQAAKETVVIQSQISLNDGERLSEFSKLVGTSVLSGVENAGYAAESGAIVCNTLLIKTESCKETHILSSAVSISKSESQSESSSVGSKADLSYSETLRESNKSIVAVYISKNEILSETGFCQQSSTLYGVGLLSILESGTFSTNILVTSSEFSAVFAALTLSSILNCQEKISEHNIWPILSSLSLKESVSVVGNIIVVNSFQSFEGSATAEISSPIVAFIFRSPDAVAFVRKKEELSDLQCIDRVSKPSKTNSMSCEPFRIESTATIRS